MRYEHTVRTLGWKVQTPIKNTLARPHTASYRITLAGEAHTVAETLTKLRAMEMVIFSLVNSGKYKLGTVLSNYTFTNHIQELSADIEQQSCAGDKIEKNEMGGACSADGEERGVYRVMVGKPEGKRPLGRPRRRWEDNIKMNLQKVGCVDWIGLA
jgi:hypothetical protein